MTDLNYALVTLADKLERDAAPRLAQATNSLDADDCAVSMVYVAMKLREALAAPTEAIESAGGAKGDVPEWVDALAEKWACCVAADHSAGPTLKQCAHEMLDAAYGRKGPPYSFVYGIGRRDNTPQPAEGDGAVAYWLAVADGTVEFGFDCADGNKGEASRTEVNDWINAQPHPGDYRLVAAYTRPAATAQEFPNA